MNIIDSLQEVKTSVKAKFVKITPKDAVALVKHTAKEKFANRSCSERHVKFLARQMSENGWKINGETIILDTKNRVINGQHRLMACIDAGTPFQTLLVYNVPANEFSTMDSGLKRTASQTMQVAGVENYSVIANIVSAIFHMEDSNGLSMQANHSDKRSNNDFLAFAKDNYNDVQAAAMFAVDAHKNAGKGLSVRILGTLYYYLVAMKRQDAVLVGDFLTDLTSADSSKCKALNHIRRDFIENSSVRARDDAYLYIIQVAWNAIHDDMPVPTRGIKIMSISDSLSQNKDDDSKKKIIMPGFHV